MVRSIRDEVISGELYVLHLGPFVEEEHQLPDLPPTSPQETRPDSSDLGRPVFSPIKVFPPFFSLFTKREGAKRGPEAPV